MLSRHLLTLIWSICSADICSLWYGTFAQPTFAHFDMGYLLSWYFLTLIWDIFSADICLLWYGPFAQPNWTWVGLMIWCGGSLRTYSCFRVVNWYTTLVACPRVHISGNNNLDIWQNITSERNIIGHDHPEKGTKSEIEKKIFFKKMLERRASCTKFPEHTLGVGGSFLLRLQVFSKENICTICKKTS